MRHPSTKTLSPRSLPAREADGLYADAFARVRLVAAWVGVALNHRHAYRCLCCFAQFHLAIATNLETRVVCGFTEAPGTKSEHPQISFDPPLGCGLGASLDNPAESVDRAQVVVEHPAIPDVLVVLRSLPLVVMADSKVVRQLEKITFILR